MEGAWYGLAIGDKIRALRRSRGMTQTELGRHIGVGTSAVGMYEQNRREPDNSTLLRLCEAFSVGTDYFLREEGARDVSSLLSTLRGELMQAPALMFDGEPLTREDAAEISAAIESAVRCAMARKDTAKGDE